MTKKHFIRIAEMLKNQKIAIQGLNDKDFKILISNIENELIRIFIDDNPRFDIDKFKQATQPTEEEMRLPLWKQ